MINQLLLVGRIASIDEMEETKEHEYVNFSIAVEDKNKNCDFFRITAFDKLANVVVDYGEVGSFVAVRCHLKNGKYADKNGEMKYVTSILLDELQLIGKTGKAEDDSKYKKKGRR